MLKPASFGQEWRHGVFLRIHQMGILICGDAGIGKSSLALALLEAGHALIADDLVVFERNAAEEIIGQASNTASGLLHCRALGFVDVRACYGEAQLLSRHRLDGVVQMAQHTPPQTAARLLEPLTETRILGQAFPTVTLAASQVQAAAVVASFARLCKRAHHAGVEKLMQEQQTPAF